VRSHLICPLGLHMKRRVLTKSAAIAALLVMMTCLPTGCDATPFSSACNHPIRAQINEASRDGRWTTSSGTTYADTRLASVRVTCVSSVSSEADRVSPRAYRIPVTIDVENVVSDTGTFDALTSVRPPAEIILEAISDSDVVLSTATIRFTMKRSVAREVLSGTIGPLSPDETAKTRVIRAGIQYAR
jgi:hypothetical protein